VTLDLATIGRPIESLLFHYLISSSTDFVENVTLRDNDTSRPLTAEEGTSFAFDIARIIRVASGGMVSVPMFGETGSSTTYGFDLFVSYENDYASFAGVDPDKNFNLSKIIHAITGGAIAGEVGAPITADFTSVAGSAEGSGGGTHADGAAPSVTCCMFACDMHNELIEFVFDSSSP